MDKKKKKVIPAQQEPWALLSRNGRVLVFRQIVSRSGTALHKFVHLEITPQDVYGCGCHSVCRSLQTGAYLTGFRELPVFPYSGEAGPHCVPASPSEESGEAPSHPRHAHIPFPSDPFFFHRSHTTEWSPVAASGGFHLTCPSRPGADKNSRPHLDFP